MATIPTPFPPPDWHFWLGTALFFFTSLESYGRSPYPAPPPFGDYRVEAGSDWLSTSDLTLSLSSLGLRRLTGDTDWAFGINHASVDMDFESPDIFTTPTQVREDRFGAQLQASHRLTPSLRAQAGLQGYQGFASYATAWLHEFYRQRYGLFGYDAVEPYGIQASGGLRWEYLPGTAYLQGTVTGLARRIAPGAEFDGSLTLGNERLTTMSYAISTENILSPRIRSQLGLTFIDTTDRDLRLSLRTQLNYALGERYVLQANAAWTREPPGFDSYQAGLTVEWALQPGLLLSLTGRYYEDTGEIENSLLFSTAAPGIASWQVGLGLRYSWRRSSAKLYVAPYTTDFEPIGRGTEFFGQLYRDRDWLLIQAAYTWEF